MGWVRASPISRATEVSEATIRRGRMLQVDLRLRGRTLRLISVHIDPSWPRVTLRHVFAERTSAHDRVSCVCGDCNSIVGDEVRFQRGTQAAPAGGGPAGELADTALVHMTEM